jgi:hypothetical protein
MKHFYYIITGLVAVGTPATLLFLIIFKTHY